MYLSVGLNLSRLYLMNAEVTACVPMTSYILWIALPSKPVGIKRVHCELLVYFNSLLRKYSHCRHILFWFCFVFMCTLCSWLPFSNVSQILAMAKCLNSDVQSLMILSHFCTQTHRNMLHFESYTAFHLPNTNAWMDHHHKTQDCIKGDIKKNYKYKDVY